MKNLIMALFDPIEKLINEHGSAVIQEKHIALLREEIAILKEKFSVITSENENLKHEKNNCEEKIKELTDTINKYRNINRCPRCHGENTFQLVQRVPHFNALLATGGATLRLYRCNKCNYDETRK